MSQSRRLSKGLSTPKIPTLPPPPPVDESEMEAEGQNLFMRTAIKRAYPFVESWFREKATNYDDMVTKVEEAIMDYEEVKIPTNFEKITDVRDKRRQAKETMREKIEKAYVCGAYQERKGNAWLQHFARHGRVYLSRLEEMEEELLSRRRQAELWTVHGERERVMSRMNRFKEKYGLLLVRMEEDVANLQKQCEREEVRMKLALEACLEEIRDVVSWHVLQQSRGVQGRISAACRQQLLSILGDNPGVTKKRNHDSAMIGVGRNTCSSEGSHTRRISGHVSSLSSPHNQSGLLDSVSPGTRCYSDIITEEGEDDLGDEEDDDTQSTTSTVWGPLFAPTEEDHLCKEEEHRLRRLLRRKQLQRTLQRPAVERQRAAEEGRLKHEFHRAQREDKWMLRDIEAGSGISALPRKNTVAVPSSIDDAPVELVSTSMQETDRTGSATGSSSSSDYFKENKKMLSHDTEARIPSTRTKAAGGSSARKIPNMSNNTSQQLLTPHSPYSLRSGGGDSSRATPSIAGTPNRMRYPSSSAAHGGKTSGRHHHPSSGHTSPSASIGDRYGASLGSRSTGIGAANTSSSAPALAAAAATELKSQYKLPPSRSLAKLDKLSLPEPPGSPLHPTGGKGSVGRKGHGSPRGEKLPNIHHDKSPAATEAMKNGTLPPHSSSARTMSASVFSQQQLASAAVSNSQFPATAALSSLPSRLSHSSTCNNSLDGPPKALNTASGKRPSGEGLGTSPQSHHSQLSHASASTLPVPPAPSKFVAPSAASAVKKGPGRSQRKTMALASLNPRHTNASSTSKLSGATAEAETSRSHASRKGSRSGLQEVLSLEGEVSMSLRETDTDAAEVLSMSINRKDSEEEGRSQTSLSPEADPGETSAIRGIPAAGASQTSGRSPVGLSQQFPASAVSAPLSRKTHEKRGYVNGKLFHLKRVEPEIVMPPASGGPNGALIPTEHFNQLVFSLLQETEEMRAMLESTTSLSTALLTRLQQLKASSDQLLIENVRLERDKEAIREEIRQQAEQRDLVKDAAEFCRMREEFDCAILREEQQDAVEDLEELLRMKHAELCSTKAQIDAVSLKIRDHDSLLMRVQTYWSNNAAFLRRACGEITSSNPYHHPGRNPISRTPTHQSDGPTPSIHSLNEHSHCIARDRFSHPNDSSTDPALTERLRSPDNGYMDTARPGMMARPPDLRSRGSSPHSGTTTPVERALEKHQINLQRAADAAAGIVKLSPTNSPRCGKGSAVSGSAATTTTATTTGRVSASGKSLSLSGAESLTLHGSPREMEEYSEDVMPIYLLQLRQMDEVAEFIHSVFEVQ